MYQGHVDRITRQSVTGWAAETTTPDEYVDISIFVNGRKLAQIACDEARPDLRDIGPYGKGRHGFRYEFKPPLPDAPQVAVAVRFADSGTLLGNGNVLFASGANDGVAIDPPPERQE